MKLPRKITPCPLIDSIFELRFEPKVDPSAVFGIVYNVLRDNFSKPDKLPIVELPESFREADAGLKFKAHYKLINKNIVVQIGPRVLIVSSYPEYVGWEVLLAQIKFVFGKLSELNIVEQPIRVGLRYINFFDYNILDKINLEIAHISEKLYTNPISLRVEFKEDDINKTLQISNNAEYTLQTKKYGSTIDIDVSKINGIGDFLSNVDYYLNLIHNKEKELFFSLLKESYLNTLNPEY